MVSEIQSILFNKSYFTPEEAINWLYNHDKKYLKIDESKHFLRFRLNDPKKYSRIRTKRVTKNGVYEGIDFVFGFDPKYNDEDPIVEYGSDYEY